MIEESFYDKFYFGNLAFEEPMPKIEILAPIPTTMLRFCQDGEIVGELSWTKGKFRFEGDMEQSARLFFEGFLAPYVDGYIEDKLRST